MVRKGGGGYGFPQATLEGASGFECRPKLLVQTHAQDSSSGIEEVVLSFIRSLS